MQIKLVVVVAVSNATAAFFCRGGFLIMPSYQLPRNLKITSNCEMLNKEFELTHSKMFSLVEVLR